MKIILILNLFYDKHIFKTTVSNYQLLSLKQHVCNHEIIVITVTVFAIKFIYYQYKSENDSSLVYITHQI